MTILGIVRDATQLHALTYEVGEPHDPARPWDRRHTCVLRPYRGPLSAPWAALSAVRAWDADALGRVLAILRATVPHLEPERDLPSLGPEVHPAPPPRATAAHPRAFRGTRYKPPRSARPAAVDVRPYLLTRRCTDQVLELLGHPRGVDVYVSTRYSVDANASFEPWFVMHVLPALATCGWPDVGAFAAISRTLDLGVDSELRSALVGVYLGAADASRALAWWSHVLAHDAAGRLQAAQLVAASGVAKVEPPDATTAATIAEATPIQQWSIYRALAAGAAPAYLMSGLALGAISRTHAEVLPRGQLDVTALVETTVDRLALVMEDDWGSSYWLFRLWELCGECPGFADLLASQDVAKLSASAGVGLLEIVAMTRECGDASDACWKDLSPRLPALIEIVLELDPAYQAKLLCDLRYVLSWAAGNDYSIIRALAGALACALRVARRPFGTRSVIGIAFPSIAMLYTDEWRHRIEIENAPEASWQVLEKACDRRNDATELAYGLNRLGQLAPQLLVSSFRAAPGALLETAASLAMLSFEAAMAVLERYAASSLAQHMIADAPLAYLCSHVEPISRAGGPNPVRRALRRHLAGEVHLSGAQLAGHRDRIVAELDLVRLASIRQAVDRLLAARVGADRVEGATERHALAMLGDLTHRRQFRRMLVATRNGDRGWRDRHPRTTAWFARHPRLDREAWQRGITLTRELSPPGRIRLAFEQDPLEALKLGTYVGSCLGRGGIHEASAIAVVLDANKQVVYARDERGAVLARQLIAISEDDRLVCFHVYGPDRSLLEPVFREFRPGAREGPRTVAVLLVGDGRWLQDRVDPFELLVRRRSLGAVDG